MNTVSPSPATEVRAVVHKREILSDNWGVLTKYTLSYRRIDGEWQDMTREIYDREHGAVVLPYNTERGTIVLTRQFLLSAFVTGHDDDLIEACAGPLDERDPEEAILKEAEEETGMTLGRVEKIGEFYMRLGSVTERLHFFVAPYTSTVDTVAGGGVRHEGEDIHVMETLLAEALDMTDHVFTIPADHMLPVDENVLPTGEVRSVAGTLFDFRMPRPLSEGIRTADPQIMRGREYDHCYRLAEARRDAPAFAVRVTDPISGRMLEVFTTEPGIQLHSGNVLSGRFRGDAGRTYRQTDGFCLEAQQFPDAPNWPEFPSCVVSPVTGLQAETIYRLGLAL